MVTSPGRTLVGVGANRRGVKTRGQPPGSAQLGHPTPRQNHRAARSWAEVQSHNLMVLARLGGDNVTTGPPYAAPWRLPVHSPCFGEGRSLPSSPTAPGHTGAEGLAQLHYLCFYAQFPLHRVALGVPEAPGLSRKDCDSPPLVLDPVSPTSFRPTERQ